MEVRKGITVLLVIELRKGEIESHEREEGSQTEKAVSPDGGRPLRGLQRGVDGLQAVASADLRDLRRSVPDRPSVRAVGHEIPER